MVLTGLEIIIKKLPSQLRGKRIGILCHAPSITRNFAHITDIFYGRNDCRLSALFGPQHGLFGETQDNMIEWEGQSHPLFNIPVYSLYGKTRKPSPEMLKDIDILLIDLQDIGSRIYTYVWTVKQCIEACGKAGIPILVLDRPNPVGVLPFDGPVLKKEYFTFVGGASVPLCHRMTIGEMTNWIRQKDYPGAEVNIVWMKGWKRNSLYSDTGLPWILPSPNMPTQNTAIVYPGTVLLEGLNLSEGRGTTIPFELFGAPFINAQLLKKNLDSRKIPGCVFRIHNFIPAFNKYMDKLCQGIQIHITDTPKYYPAGVVLDILDAVIETSGPDALNFNPPPYEYENKLIPFDILSGDSGMRTSLLKRLPVSFEKERWKEEINKFKKEFAEFSAYPE